jgi:hypothetical protein
MKSQLKTGLHKQTPIYKNAIAYVTALKYYPHI